MPKNMACLLNICLIDLCCKIGTNIKNKNRQEPEQQALRILFELTRGNILVVRGKRAEPKQNQ